MSQDVAPSPDPKPILPVRIDWYQIDSAVVITLLVKNVGKDQLKISISESTIQVDINMPEFQEYTRCINLSHKIVPEQSSYKLETFKIEIRLKKTEAVRWSKLEGELIEENIKAIPQASNPLELDRPPSYPTSKKGKDWNQIEKEIKKQEEQEKPEGEEALNKLFQDIYGKGSDEVRKAMNKSYLESGGTVLSTNWNEVAKQKVDVKPPDGMEFKKWDS